MLALCKTSRPRQPDHRHQCRLLLPHVRARRANCHTRAGDNGPAQSLLGGHDISRGTVVARHEQAAEQHHAETRAEDGQDKPPPPVDGPVDAPEVLRVH